MNMFTLRQFKPDIQYWLNPNNTYRVVFIQNQASWFVVTGHDFTVDAHSEGGINGNGQASNSETLPFCLLDAMTNCVAVVGLFHIAHSRRWRRSPSFPYTLPRPACNGPQLLHRCSAVLVQHGCRLDRRGIRWHEVQCNEWE